MFAKLLVMPRAGSLTKLVGDREKSSKKVAILWMGDVGEKDYFKQWF